MAVSGSYNFSITRNDIVQYALYNVGAIGEGVTPTSTQYTDGSFYLNLIMKAWHNDGMPLWALKEGYIFPINDTNTVDLGTTGDHASLAYTHTQLSADEAAAQTVLSVDSITGISDTNIVGVELDNGNMHWTTISGAPAGGTITLASALPSAASTDNHIYVYSTKLMRPLKILEASRLDLESNTDSPIRVVTHNEFFELSNKTTEGEPNTLWYNQRINLDSDLTALDGQVNFWPRFSNGRSLIKIWFHAPFSDFDTSADNPDCPQSFYMALVWALSWALCPAHGVPMDQRKQMFAEAEKLKKEALDFNMEEGSLLISPEYGHSNARK